MARRFPPIALCLALWSTGFLHANAVAAVSGPTWGHRSDWASESLGGAQRAALVQSDNPPPLAPAPRGAPRPTTPAAPTARSEPTPRVVAPAPVAAKDGLDPTPLVFESLGLRMRPPANTVMRTDGSGANATWTLAERADPPRYLLRISRLVASAANSSPAEQMDEYIKSVGERPAGDAAFTVRARRELTLGGQPAGLLYTTLREGEGADAVAAVQGYLLVQTEPNEFIVISSLVGEAEFSAVSALLDRAYGTIELIPAEEVSQARAARMAAGQHLIDGLDEDALRRALDPSTDRTRPPPPRWYRITRNLADGEVQEAGYMTMSVVEAPQGEANPDRPAANWSAEEKEMGMLVRLQVRMLLDKEGTAVADTDSRVWLRWDRAREFWTSRTTSRRGRATHTNSQLGIRQPPSVAQPRPVIEVASVNPSQEATDPKRWPMPTVAYLSQAEALVLPRLLPNDATVKEYGFYWFDPRANRVVQRLDRRTPVPGGFQLGTQPSLESPMMEQVLDPRGMLQRRETDDGTVTELVDPKTLLEIWRKQGLPTG